ncbi:MAG: apolipoprotein N-acyltransferase [Puniceicoccales bacterium]|nr:apolipoprotein N-acyltransferase [Puniceicoccales bacterium]
MVGVAAAGLYSSAMPGVNFAEAAWLWAIPFALWSTTRPAWKTWLLVAGVTFWLAKIGTLVWLRHVSPPLGWLGLVLLTALLALFPVAWLALLRWLFPKTVGAPPVFRIIIQLGLAGAWVTLEWVQGWLLTGFPWALLAETQWQRPVALALCAYGGPWALGFAIILFNIGLARHIHNLAWARQNAPVEAAPSPFAILRNVSPEFYIGILPVFFAIFVFWNSLNKMHDHAEKLFTAGFVQTDFDPNAKWDAARVQENIAVVRTLTRDVARLPAPPAVVGGAPGNKFVSDDANGRHSFALHSASMPQLIFWPEAALPLSAGSESFDGFVTGLARETGATLVYGAIRSEEKGYYNGIFTATSAGVSKAFYAKRHLVPFGEYVPLADILPLRRVVPIPQDSLVGARVEPLPVPVDGRVLRAGTLVCYEDVFPDLSRDMARRGADFIVVVTNDAWYGREAGAYQHAAHSAVMAASLRLPVVRCGNNGWSGVFTPLGQQLPITDASGSIYFRGAGRLDVMGIPEEVREPTFYMVNGNWVVTMSILLTLWVCVRNRLRFRKAEE